MVYDAVIVIHLIYIMRLQLQAVAMNASNHSVTLVTNFTPEIGITRQMNCILSLQWLSVVLFQIKMASFKSTAMNQSNLSYGNLETETINGVI